MTFLSNGKSKKSTKIIRTFPIYDNSLAICIVGGARSFPVEEYSIPLHLKERVIDALRPSKVDLFYTMSFTNVTESHKAGWFNFNDSSFNQPFKILPPTNLLQTDPPFNVTSYWNVRLENECTQPSFCFPQFAKWSLCYDQMVQQEFKQGWRYDWVIKTRPDVVLRGSLPTLKAMKENELTLSTINISSLQSKIMGEKSHSQVTKRENPLSQSILLKDDSLLKDQLDAVFFSSISSVADGVYPLWYVNMYFNDMLIMAPRQMAPLFLQAIHHKCPSVDICIHRQKSCECWARKSVELNGGVIRHFPEIKEASWLIHRMPDPIKEEEMRRRDCETRHGGHRHRNNCDKYRKNG